MSLKLTRWDPAESLNTDRDMAGYLEAIMEDPTPPELVRSALGDIARAMGIREISKQTGIDLKELKRAFLTDDVPDLKTVSKLIRALSPKAPSVPRETRMGKTVTRVRPNVKRTKSKAS